MSRIFRYQRRYYFYTRGERFGEIVVYLVVLFFAFSIGFIVGGW